MICVGGHPFHLPARVEPSIEENKECPCYCLMIIMSFPCVPNQDRQGGAVTLHCLAPRGSIYSKPKWT